MSQGNPWWAIKRKTKSVNAPLCENRKSYQTEKACRVVGEAFQKKLQNQDLLILTMKQLRVY